MRRLGSCAIADCLVCGFVAGENIQIRVAKTLLALGFSDSLVGSEVKASAPQLKIAP